MESSYPYTTSRGRRPVQRDSHRPISLDRDGHDVSSRSGPELPPPLLTVRELAVLLATSSSGVYARVARGQIPGVLRIGRTLRFDPRVVAQWLSANKASAGGLS